MGLSVAALSLGACTENFEELNTRPDALVADNLDKTYWVMHLQMHKLVPCT